MDKPTAETPDSSLRQALDGLAVLSGRPYQVTELSGGLTNRNYKVVTSDGAYVVRMSPGQADLLAIDRFNEFRNSVSAAGSGVGAPVIDYLPAHGALVIGFIDGVTFTDESFRVPGNIRRAAQSVRRLHQGERFVNDFDMFRIQSDYLAVVRERGFRLPGGYLDLMPKSADIRAALAVRQEPTVPCNNDLLAGNFVDDGSQVWLIDYEYSGNNDACFELGNIWSECHLSLDQLEELVTAYYGRPLRNKIARALLQGLMSKYGWTLWASIQDATSELDFDFWSWGMEKYEAAVEMFRGGDFARLLDDVQRTD
ncbi:phosphotransferase [Streptosporangium sp. NPDC000396]|uniref:phosphotransferase n=1 Tax=Streptosporangium sp. NPDC000396 TaxID=3366185 RepID=UPI0036C626BB